MPRIPVRAWLAIGGFFVLPGALYAQEPAQALVDRARQIQGEVEAEAQAQDASQGPGAQVSALPEIGEEEMRALVRQSLGVEILRVDVIERDGQPAYAITVMNPPGDRNDAFRIATLLFDGATGRLLGQQSSAPQAAAPDLPTATAPSGSESKGPEIRRRTNR